MRRAALFVIFTTSFVFFLLTQFISLDFFALEQALQYFWVADDA